MPSSNSRRSVRNLQKRRRLRRLRRIRALAIFCVLLCAGGLLVWRLTRPKDVPAPVATAAPTVEAATPDQTSDPTAEPTAAPTQAPTPEPAPTPLPDFSPEAVSGTRAEDFGIEGNVMVDDKKVKTYAREEAIDFATGDEYTALEGVTTFRGNNFRDGGAYGTVSMSAFKFGSDPWKFKIGSLKKVYNSGAGSGSWTGCGWTGQPLIVKWPEETKKIMNLFDGAKENPDLVEVIYATMDGCVYFFDLETGQQTRKPISIGFPFKGAGTLDPRGYPILYLGAGDDGPKRGTARALIVSLIDGSILYQYGANEDFAYRNWPKFDSAPLVDAETDTLISMGENGVVYTMKLNTNYDPEAGTISVSPKPIAKWRYKGTRSNKSGVNGVKAWWVGMEDSPIVWRGCAIFSDNGGHLMCLDLNSFEVKWVQDTLDDTNCTPVLELEDGHAYVYTSTSFHGGWRVKTEGTAEIPVWKIDAETGEVVWSKSFRCETMSGVSGGVQGTIAMGKNSLSDYVFVPVAMHEGKGGLLIALNKSDGSEAWRREFKGYLWSSPVAVYDEAGNGYLIQCNKSGYIHLIDGKTGEILDERDLGSNVEATPAVYGNHIVVGTRGSFIYGITLT